VIERYFNMRKSRVLYILFFMLCYSCSGTNNSINVQIVRHSSELLGCDKIFADNLQAIEERNEILLQTGSIDTTDEQPPVKSAILTIDKNETILTLIDVTTTNKETIEKYQGNGYNLTLTYQNTVGKYDKLIYIGKFIIENSKSKREFKIEGKNCVL